MHKPLPFNPYEISKQLEPAKKAEEKNSKSVEQENRPSKKAAKTADHDVFAPAPIKNNYRE